jgi:germination protein YpeB
VEISHYQVYDGMAVLNFAPLQDGVILYPDLVKVQLRMDTGEVVGLEAHHYLMNHARRENLDAALSLEEALGKAEGRLEKTEVRLCLIPYRQSERLCYEVRGEKDGQEYRLYIDASNGAEVEVHMMVDSTDGPLDV